MNICLRCHGFLITEAWPYLGVVYLRCLNCGDLTDEVILVNRLHSKPPAWTVAEIMLTDLRGSPT